MAKGIVVCGLNGCGKSTLGRALAEKMGLYFIDNENLYFSRNAADEPYANPRTRAEAEALLMEEVRRHGDFVFAAVKGGLRRSYFAAVSVRGADRGAERDSPAAGARPFLSEIRRQDEAGRRFVRIGGSLFPNSGSTPEDYAESWARTLSCPVVVVDGTRPVEENVERLAGLLRL